MTCVSPVAHDASVGHPAMLDPWAMAAEWGTGTVLAVLTATEGPAYRDHGTAMAITADGRFAGAITSGCVEADLILRADQVRASGRIQRLRYGQGSPFFDLRLPCGGAVEVLLFPLQDRDVLSELAFLRAKRAPVGLEITQDGRLALRDWQVTGRQGDTFVIGFRPGIRLLAFGTGAEATAFCGLARGMGYDHLLLSHEEASLAPAQAAGSPVRLIHALSDFDRLEVDGDTAVVLFYHDHDYEPSILRQLVGSPAFYIGAQGSRATQARRLERLRNMGLSSADLARIHGPIGLIPSSRDPKSLAVSVFVEILAVHGRSGAVNR